MNKEEFLVARRESTLFTIHSSRDWSLVNGKNITRVSFDNTTGKYWQTRYSDYRDLAIGMEDESIDSDFSLVEVVPIQKAVMTTVYEPVTAPSPALSPALAESPALTLSDGSPVTDDHKEIDPVTGMQKGYVVLSEQERAAGLVEPVRLSYTHERCGTNTDMALSIATTYAVSPEFYSGTYCSNCRTHGPVGEFGEFVWKGTKQKVGTRRESGVA